MAKTPKHLLDPVAQLEVMFTSASIYKAVEDESVSWLNKAYDIVSKSIVRNSDMKLPRFISDRLGRVKIDIVYAFVLQATLLAIICIKEDVEPKTDFVRLCWIGLRLKRAN